MLPSLLQFLISAAIIIAAGSVLTQFGDIISHRTKLGGLLVGTILIAGATAPPELAVDVNAVRMGAPDLAVGDLMGSSPFNLLILAVLDLTRYIRGRMLSETSARHALAATVSIALTAIAAIFIQLGDKLDSLTFLRIGPGSVALVAAYALGIRLIFNTRGNNEEPSGKEKPTSWIPWVGKLKLRGAISILATSTNSSNERPPRGAVFLSTSEIDRTEGGKGKVTLTQDAYPNATRQWLWELRRAFRELEVARQRSNRGSTPTESA